MTYKPPKTEAEKLRDGARQLRRRTLLENWFFPKMLKELQLIAKDSAAAYVEGGREQALVEANTHRPRIEATLETFYNRAIDTTSGTIKFGLAGNRRKDFLGAVDRVVDFFRQYAFEQSVLITETSRKEVEEAIEKSVADSESDQEVAKIIKTKVSTLSIGRARAIARTEALTATVTTQDELVRELDLPTLKKEWVARLDSRTRDPHRHVDGETVGMDEFFNVDGKRMKYPGDKNGGPENVINCRCTVVYVPEDF